MDILVNRFAVKYNGVKYGPDHKENIIKNVPENIAEELIANSNGTIIKLSSTESEADINTPDEQKNETDKKNTEGKDSDKLNLPPVKPTDSVKK